VIKVQQRAEQDILPVIQGQVPVPIGLIIIQETVLKITYQLEQLIIETMLPRRLLVEMYHPEIRHLDRLTMPHLKEIVAQLIHPLQEAAMLMVRAIQLPAPADRVIQHPAPAVLHQVAAIRHQNHQDPVIQHPDHPVLLRAHLRVPPIQLPKAVQVHPVHLLPPVRVVQVPEEDKKVCILNIKS
jgi:hypothetical protein